MYNMESSNTTHLNTRRSSTECRYELLACLLTGQLCFSIILKSNVPLFNYGMLLAELSLSLSLNESASCGSVCTNDAGVVVERGG